MPFVSLRSQNLVPHKGNPLTRKPRMPAPYRVFHVQTRMLVFIFCFSCAVLLTRFRPTQVQHVAVRCMYRVVLCIASVCPGGFQIFLRSWRNFALTRHSQRSRTCAFHFYTSPLGQAKYFIISSRLMRGGFFLLRIYTVKPVPRTGLARAIVRLALVRPDINFWE